MRQGTREEGTELCVDGARGRGWEEASGGEREHRREVEEQLREDRRRKGDREGGKRQWKYPGGHWPVHITTHNAALALETLVWPITN